MSAPHRRSAGPLQLRRLALGCVLAGAVAAGAGSGIRAGRSTGEAPTYLFDVLGLALAVAGAVLEARAGAILLPAGYPGAKRRALALATVGLLVALTGCVLLSSVLTGSGGRLAAGVAAAAGMAGFGAGFGGLGTLVWVYGIDYAGRKIEHMNNDG